MIKSNLMAIAMGFLVWACASEGQPEQQADQAAEAVAVEEDGRHFGETIDESNAVTMSELRTQLAEADSVKAKVVASVQSVCQKKGCWMNLAEAEGESEMMVRFVDYGFFVPKDIAGRQVIVEGQAYREVVPVDELRHYAEDAGKSEEEIAAITEPEERLTFLASGVLLMD